MLDIGQKLRAARVSQNLSLRELATKAEVSASLLSQIENGKANPSVRSLHSIAEALALSVDHFFPAKKAEGKIVEASTATEVILDKTASQMRTGQPATAIGNETPFEDSDGPKPPITQAGQRPTIELEGGVTWTRLTPNQEDGIEFLQSRYDIGASSGEKMSHHSGREFGMVLKGTLQVELGFETYRLEAGDTIIFNSSTPHRLTNIGEVPVEAVWVIYSQ